MTNPTIPFFGFRPARPKRPRYRSWDIDVTQPDGGTYTESNTRKVDALAAMAEHIKQGCTVKGPFGNPRAI